MKPPLVKTAPRFIRSFHRGPVVAHHALPGAAATTPDGLHEKGPAAAGGVDAAAASQDAATAAAGACYCSVTAAAVVYTIVALGFLLLLLHCVRYQCIIKWTVIGRGLSPCCVAALLPR